MGIYRDDHDGGGSSDVIWRLGDVIVLQAHHMNEPCSWCSVLTSASTSIEPQTKLVT